MRCCKLLFLLAIGLLFASINARVIRRHKKICKRPPPKCACPQSVIEIPCPCKSILEPCGGLGACNGPNIFLDQLPNYACGCRYDTNFDRVPAIKLPCVASNKFDAGAPLSALSLPGLFDFVVDLPSCQCQGLPSCLCQELPLVADFAPPCQVPIPSFQCVDTPCGCRTMQAPIVEYISPVDVPIPNPIIKVPYAEPYYIQAPPCGCPSKIECGCQNVNSCRCQNVVNTPCCCDNGLKVSYGLPCGCQNSVNCGCQNPINCGCQNPINCGCQNVIQYGAQLPVLDLPCAWQSCQLSPVELPVYGYGCQSLPPVCGCSGQYLRQVALQPPFL